MFKKTDTPYIYPATTFTSQTINKYVERTIPGQYVHIFVNRWRVTFLSIDGVLAANQLNPTL